jgi:hypothetical protein
MSYPVHHPVGLVVDRSSTVLPGWSGLLEISLSFVLELLWCSGWRIRPRALSSSHPARRGRAGPPPSDPTRDTYDTANGGGGNNMVRTDEAADFSTIYVY